MSPKDDKNNVKSPSAPLAAALLGLGRGQMLNGYKTGDWTCTNIHHPFQCVFEKGTQPPTALIELRSGVK